MARTSLDQPILSATSRKKLAPRDNAYFRRVTDLISVGYRRGVKLPGAWTVRTQDANGKYSQRKLTGVADDLEKPNGRDVLNYDQAVGLAREEVAPAPVDLTVEAALIAWAENKIAEGQSESGERNLWSLIKRLTNWFGPKRVSDLKVRDIDKFRDSFLIGYTDDRLRARRATANRELASLKAALTFAAEAEAPDMPRPWEKTKKFKKTESFGKRLIVCTPEQEAEIYAACPTQELKALWQAGFLTGCRLGELVDANIEQYSPRRLSVDGKTGARTFVLSVTADKFFSDLAARRNDPTGPLLTDENGERWRKGRIDKLLPASVKASGGVDPATTFYATRHTFITRYLTRGVPAMAVAKQVGTSLAMLEQTYANFLAQDLEDWFND